MSKSGCTRVGCLRIPWFPIDVLRRSGRVATGSPLALVAGRGTHGKIAAVDPAARALGARIGMRPSQARGLSATLDLAPWDEELDRDLETAGDALTEALEAVSPRLTMVGPGVAWLEPVSHLGRVARGREAEDGFARRVLRIVERQGYPGARVAVADGPVAAEAGTRVGGEPVRWIPPGTDRSFLAGLPLRALRLSERVRALLGDLGVRRVGTLQGMNVNELEARFGPEGRWAWRVAIGHDPRRPVTPRPRPELRAGLVLEGPTDRLEPLLFALRPTVQRVVLRLARRGRAVARAEIVLQRGWGADVAVRIVPSRPVAAEDLVFELVRRRLQEPGVLDPAGGPIVAAVFEVVRTAGLAPRQGDLFAATWRDPGAAESALVRVNGRLGESAVVHARELSERRPERRADWRPVAGSDGPQPPLASRGTSDGPGRVLRACLRLLPEPAPAEPRRDGRLVVRGADVGTVTVRTWHGPERLSGHWWEDAYDRDYYWALAGDGRVFWVYRDRVLGGWFLHGWLD